MPDLNLGPPPERNPLPAILIAAAILIGIFALLFEFNPHVTTQIAVQKIDLFDPHTEFKQTPGSARLLGVPASVEDDLYVLASLRITNKLRFPIFLDSYSATMTNADGSTVDATLVPPAQFQRLEDILPPVKPMLTQPQIGQPVQYDFKLDPGPPRVGFVLLLFPQISEAQWRAKKSATITLICGTSGPRYSNFRSRRVGSIDSASVIVHTQIEDIRSSVVLDLPLR